MEKDDRPEVVGFTVILSQPPDCCDRSGDVQELTISFEDGGGGAFPVISTKRWACDDQSELIRLITLVADARQRLCDAIVGEDDV